MFGTSASPTVVSGANLARARCAATLDVRAKPGPDVPCRGCAGTTVDGPRSALGVAPLMRMWLAYDSRRAGRCPRRASRCRRRASRRPVRAKAHAPREGPRGEPRDAMPRPSSSLSCQIRTQRLLNSSFRASRGARCGRFSRVERAMGGWGPPNDVQTWFGAPNTHMVRRWSETRLPRCVGSSEMRRPRCVGGSRSGCRGA